MKDAPCSAIITVGALVLPEMMRGMIDASITRSAIDATHAQPIVDDGAVVAAHPARADRMEDRGAEVARRAHELGIRLARRRPAVFRAARSSRAPAPP